MKKTLSIILSIIMILSALPVVSLAADGDACTVRDCTGTYTDGICTICGGDGEKLRIDLSTAEAFVDSSGGRTIYLQSTSSGEGHYGDPDGYFLTGTAVDLYITNLALIKTPYEVVFNNVTFDYFMNVSGDAYFTFNGTNVIGNGEHAITNDREFNITLNGDVEIKGDVYTNLDYDSQVNVESGNVTFNLEGIHATSMGIRPVLNVKGGTAKILSSDNVRTFYSDVILHNGAKLIMESSGSYIYISERDGFFKKADGVAENTYFFVKTSADGVVVPTNDLSVYFDSIFDYRINYPYFELTIGTHDKHDYTDGICVCGYECPHDKWIDAVCDECQKVCDHMCHSDNLFIGIIWDIVNFFQKLFKINQYCECGAAHW